MSHLKNAIIIELNPYLFKDKEKYLLKLKKILEELGSEVSILGYNTLMIDEEIFDVNVRYERNKQNAKTVLRKIKIKDSIKK